MTDKKAHKALLMASKKAGDTAWRAVREMIQTRIRAAEQLSEVADPSNVKTYEKAIATLRELDDSIEALRTTVNSLVDEKLKSLGVDPVSYPVNEKIEA